MTENATTDTWTWGERLAVTLKYLVCSVRTLGRHHYIYKFEPDRWFQVCCSCHHETSGWVIDAPPPRKLAAPVRPHLVERRKVS
jgi:hypothetical protein